MSITNDRNDFVTFSNKSSLSELKGFAKDGITTVEGEGDVVWNIQDTNGIRRSLKHTMFHPVESALQV